MGCHAFGVAADFCKIIDGAASWAGTGDFCAIWRTSTVLCRAWTGASQNYRIPSSIRTRPRCTLEEQLQLFAGIVTGIRKITVRIVKNRLSARATAVKVLAQYSPCLFQPAF